MDLHQWHLPGTRPAVLTVGRILVFVAAAQQRDDLDSLDARQPRQPLGLPEPRKARDGNPIPIGQKNPVPDGTGQEVIMGGANVPTHA